MRVLGISVVYLFLVAVVGLGFDPAQALAQAPRDVTTTAKPTDESPADAVRALESLRPSRPPLLREGSLVVEVEGVMALDPSTGQWRFQISADETDAAGYELIMLPNTLLGEMVAIVTSSPGARVVFEATGEIFVFRNWNYLLPTHPPRIVRHEQLTIQRDIEPGVPTSEEIAADPAFPTPGSTEGDSTADIMRRLEEAAGPIAPPISIDTDAGSPPPEIIADGPTSQNADESPSIEKLFREGSVIHARRGTLRRASGGAWIFAFDADATGLEDPPLVILPCLLLERMQNYARRAGEVSPVLLSGRVFVFENRNYLLPTVFRIPVEMTRVSPAP